MKKSKLLSLFSGCGGMDIGFEGGFQCLKKSINSKINIDWIENEKGDWVYLKETMFDTVFANDIRPDAKIAWMNYFANKKTEDIYHLESIVELVKKEYSGETIFPKNIDIVTGGFPCQDFSIAGKRLGFKSQKNHLGKYLSDDDEVNEENRGKLYIWMREVISIVQPKLFIAENVKGLTNLEDVKEIIEKDFANAGGGYLVIPAQVLYAADYGVPQSRERVIFFGFKKNALTKKAKIELSKINILDEYNPYPTKTHSSTDNSLMPYVTCEEILNGLAEPEQSNDLSQQKYSKAKYMGRHCQGQTEIKLNDIAPTIRSEHHGNIEFRRLSEEHGGKNIKELKQGLPERRLTVRECARIQTFPDNYQFIFPKRKNMLGVSSSDAYKIIGNAVPCLLAYHIAKNIEKKWNIYFGE